MAAQQRLQISELQFDKSYTCNVFLLEDEIHNPGKFLFRFFLGGFVMDQKVEMVDSVDDSQSSRSIQGKTHFLNFEMLDAGNASALNKIIQNFYLKKKVSLEEQKHQKEDRFLRRRPITFMIHDNFRVTGARDAVLVCADLFSITLRNDDFRNSIRDGMKFYCL